MIQYDAIRLIAILAIVLLHAAANGVTQLPAGSGNWWLANLADSAGRVGVPLFLMLSGAILLTRQQESIRHFYQRRWQRLAWPTLIWSLLYLCWAQFKAYWKQQPLALSDQLTGIITGHSYFHLWFVYLLIGLYGVLPFVRWLWQQLNRRQQIAVTVAALSLQQLGLALRFCADGCTPLTTVSWTVPHWLVNADQLPWPFWFVAYLPYLLLGALLKQPAAQPQPHLLRLLLAAAIISTACLYALQRLHYSPEPFYYAYHRLSLPVMCSAILLWYLVFRKRSNSTAHNTTVKPSGFSAAIIQHSFGIYLVHPIWLDLSNMLLQQPPLQALPYLLQLPLQTLAILLGSLVSCIYWHKWRGTAKTP